MTVLKRIVVCFATLLILNAGITANLWASAEPAAGRDTVTRTSPEDHAASTRKLPEAQKGAWGKYKWWIIGSLVLIAGGAAAAGGGGGGSGGDGGGDNGGGSEDASVTVGW